MIKIANTPLSWGAHEFGLDGITPGFFQVLSEMKETGYDGTELGELSFMPTIAFELRKAMMDSGLQLPGAFVSVPLSIPGEIEKGMDKARKAAGLLYHAGFEDAFIILADETGSVEKRTHHAGRVTEELGLSDAEWESFARGAEQVASEVRREFALDTLFLHHCGSYVETPDELARFMELTDPEILGLCLDTGQYAFGGGNPVEAFREYFDRIRYVRFKDLNPRIDEEAARNNYDYFRSVEEGVFCELGKGSVDLKSMAEVLIEREYNGWIVVEQDLLPGMGSPKSYARKNWEYLKKIGL